MLAAHGDVAADINHGELTLLGSSGDDRVSIVAGPATGDVVVRGREGTLVNGLPEIRFKSVTDLRVNLHGGDNDLAMQSSSTGLSTFESMDVRTGNGNDVLWLDHLRFTDSISVVTLRGNDLVVISDSWLSNLRLNVGVGDDGVQLSGNRIDGSSRVIGESGVDAIDIRGNTLMNSPLDDRFFVSAGSDDDHVNFVANTIRSGNSAWIDGDSGDNDGLIVGVTAKSFADGSHGDPWPALHQLQLSVGWSRYRAVQGSVVHDVRVTLSGGVATILGTQFDDRLFVDTRRRSGGRQEITIQGLPGTSVNGQASFVLPDVKAIVVKLYGGDDWFLMSDLIRGISAQVTFYDFFDVDLGSGNDFFELVVPEVRGVLSIAAGSGDDFVHLSFVKAQRLELDGGEGDDAYWIDQSQLASASVLDSSVYTNRHLLYGVLVLHGRRLPDDSIWVR